MREWAKRPKLLKGVIRKCYLVKYLVSSICTV